MVQEWGKANQDKELIKTQLKTSFFIIALTLASVSMIALSSNVESTLSSGFNESCNTWNTTYWSYTWNKPTVSSGTWVFSVQAGEHKNIQANYKLDSSYGIYELRFKTSGLRTANNVIWFFLYGHYPDYSANQQELDFFEIWNKAGHSTGEYSLSFWVNGSTGTMGIGYWYFNTITDHSINFEDGNYHLFSYNYTEEDLIISIDGVKIWSWLEDCTNQNESDIHPVNPTTHSRIGYLGMPIPPMQLMVGMGQKTGTTTAYTMTVDYISYTPVNETIPEDDEIPDPMPPDVQDPPGQAAHSSSGGGSGGIIIIIVLFLIVMARSNSNSRSKSTMPRF